MPGSCGLAGYLPPGALADVGSRRLLFKALDYRYEEALYTGPLVVLVDARTAEVTAMPQRAWYLTVLQLSQPLHFGDYAGLPMKILWTLLDLVTIVVLGSGVYLWLRRRGPRILPDAAGPLFGEAR
jgi:hypothetical protein